MSRKKKKESDYLSRASINRIFERAKALDISQLELSNRLGYSNPSAVSRIKAGTLNINMKNIDKWAAALDTTVDYLLMNSDDPAKYAELNTSDKTIKTIMLYMQSMKQNEIQILCDVAISLIKNRQKEKRK